MRSPSRKLHSFFATSCFGRVLCAVLIFGGVSLHADDVRVSLADIIREADMNIKAQKVADAVSLLEMVLTRVGQGEALPAGITLEPIELQVANNQFQLKNLPRAEEVAKKLLTTASTGQIAADGRLVLGLSLALQNKFAEAVPVFGDLVESTVYHAKALIYRAMAAQQAGQIPVAIDAFNRLLADPQIPRDSEWADAALTLIALQLQEKNLDAASRGLELLRGKSAVVENYAGLNVLSLQLGDALMGADNPLGALAAYRTVLPRQELLRVQAQRIARMEATVSRQKSLFRNSAADADSMRRLEDRIKAVKSGVDEITKNDDYDATLYYRLGHVFQVRGGAWEAAILFERLLKDYPKSGEAENSYSGLVQAYAESGRVDKMQGAIIRFMKAMPESPLLAQAFYVGAQAAGSGGKADMQMKFLEQGVSNFPQSPLAEFMVLMQASCYFSAGKFDEAYKASDHYVTMYPQGKFIEDATYLKAMATLVLGRPAEAIKQIEAYIVQYPQGRLVADGRYRIAAANYALENYDVAEKQLTAWLADFPPEHPQRGEALSTQGDVYVALDRINDAIVSYRAALALPLSEEQVGYVLDELTKHYQAKRDYNTAAVMWEDYARDNPDSPFVINAAYWIGKLRSREGRIDDAIAQMGTIARRYVTDPTREAVERLLTQMAVLMARPPKAGPDGKRPPALTSEEIAQRVEEQLILPETRDQPTVKARVLFTEAEVASLRKDNSLRDQLFERMSTEIVPDALPPGLLGGVGDRLLAKGKLDEARVCYDYLVLHYPRSFYADFGYIGLGELAYRKGDYDNALIQFANAIDRAGARTKLLESTLGRAKTLLAMGNYDVAKELFEQIASNRQWRGEATAQSVYSLGEILAKRGGYENLAQAQAHFQRVFISYRKFTPWVAKAYLSSGETFERLGQLKEALATYREMVKDSRFESYPEVDKARARISVLELQLTPSSLVPVKGGAS